VNVVVKGPPWIPKRDSYDYLTSFMKDDMQLLQDCGLNVIRLGMMWPGVEPVKGKANTLLNVVTIVKFS
jgi:endoglycosylceramidase